ncbi:MAG TPA: class I SAM-dependent methyltransferase [Gemmatimonadales bacterium]|nr:class I SAM-dependent methyltransferase [Gemmatimonadales bacterium]
MSNHTTSDTDAERFSFTPFTRHPFFTYVNRWMVDRVVQPDRKVVVDLGCGPGAVTKLIVERLGEAPDAKVIGVDPSPSALARARAAVGSCVAEFVEGSAEWLSRLVSSADAVVFLNAIHLIHDKPKVLREIRRVLREGGVLGFNSTFFNGAYVEGTGGFWRRWVVRAMQVLKERGITVARSPADKAQALQWLTPDEYSALCVEAGFAAPTCELVQVELPPQSLRDIGNFSLFIEGALPGVPLEEGASALEEGLARTLSELNVSSIARYWMECVAVAA